MSDTQQVRNAGISRAVIVDDGYDEVPQVSELRDEGAWDSLFDDAQGAAAARIEALFPTYDPQDREELKSSQEFIDALWEGRDSIRDLLGGLFDDYEQKISENYPFLSAAEAALTALDIPFEKCGRNFVAPAMEADLIVIDLFLGIQQGALDREYTVERLKETIELRGDRPLPSIILMSRVPQIAELASDFRRDAKLHGSFFRHIRKTHLSEPGRMKGLILTLASHRQDSQALARFVETWEAKANDAVSAASGTLRKIDIDDLQHIRNMLLRFEGLNTSSYILDVFDRVLQYEIESHAAVLDAAALLDEMADDPPPLRISNDRDTYAVLEQTLFVNPKRRAHATGAEWPITFGDILAPKPEIDPKPRGFFGGRTDLVFFVASPECDFIRQGALKTALLVAGSLKEIDTAKPDLAVKTNTTPVLVLDGGRRFQVDWEFGNLRTINLDQARRLLHSNHSYMTVVARLREGSALSLRQQLLSNIGRIGELAPLPRSLKFRARLYVPLENDEVRSLDLPNDVAITGNILIPRKGKFSAAIFDSDCEDDLTAAMLALDLTDTARHSRRMLETLKEQTRLRQVFRSGFQGIELPLTCPRTAGLLKPDEELPESDDKKPKTDNVATVIKGESIEGQLGSRHSKAGLIVLIQVDDAG